MTRKRSCSLRGASHPTSDAPQKGHRFNPPKSVALLFQWDMPNTRLNQPRVTTPPRYATWQAKTADGKSYRVEALRGRLTVSVGDRILDIPAELTEWFLDSVQQAVQWNEEESILVEASNK